jgi:hypothetical protein
MNITPEINEKIVEVFGMEDGSNVKSVDEKGKEKYIPKSVIKGLASDRLVIRFDPDTMNIYREGTKRNVDGNRLRGAVVTHFSRNEGARTPTGGLFTAIRFTISYQGRKWVGQTKGGTDVVRLRPMPTTNGPKDS